jgi:hypothetical protein
MGNIFSLARGKFMEQLGNSCGDIKSWQPCAARRLALIVCMLLIYKYLPRLRSKDCAAAPSWLGTQSAVSCLSFSSGESK